MKVQVVLRCDASATVGLGHLTRCMALAERLQEWGLGCLFVCRGGGSEVDAELRRHRFEVIYACTAGPEDDARLLVEVLHSHKASVAVIDHYGATDEYQRVLVEAGVTWLQFDRLRGYPLWARWVLNPSPAASRDDYLTIRRAPATQLLLGPAYLPLRRQFEQMRRSITARSEIRRVLVCLGGGDDAGAAAHCVIPVLQLPRAVSIDVVVSEFSQSLAELLRLAKENSGDRLRVHVGERSMAKRMADADVGVLSGGTLMFEAAALGLPALIVQTAENQAAVSKAWSRLGVGVDLGRAGDLDVGRLKRHLLELVADPVRLHAMSTAGLDAVDGAGAARVAGILAAGEAANA